MQTELFYELPFNNDNVLHVGNAVQIYVDISFRNKYDYSSVDISDLLHVESDPVNLYSFNLSLSPSVSLSPGYTPLKTNWSPVN